MYLLGHLGAVLLVYAPVAYLLVCRRYGWQMCTGAVALLLFAMAPDVDTQVVGLAHRGITHTLWAAPVLGMLFALAAWLLCAADLRPRATILGGFGIGNLAVFGHLLADIVTPMGVRPLAPLAPNSYTLDLVAANHPGANRVLLAAGLLSVATAVVLARHRPVNPGVDRPHGASADA